VAVLQAPLEVAVDPHPGSLEGDVGAGGERRAHERRAAADKVLSDPFVDVGLRPAEVVARHPVACDGQPGLEMQ
jgi:hypothetical protein